MREGKKFRLTYWLGFILIAFLLGSAFFLQMYKGMTPCPLCILQRLAMAALGIIFLIGAVVKFKKWGGLCISVSGLLASVSGMLLAGRQVWLQVSPPASSGDCSASLEYLFHVLSFKEALQQVWLGGMECSQRGWEFLHLSLAAWSLIVFIFLFLLTIVQLIRAAIG